jgi:hypothetical protein
VPRFSGNVSTTGKIVLQYGGNIKINRPSSMIIFSHFQLFLRSGRTRCYNFTITKIRLDLDFDCFDFLMNNDILLNKIRPNDKYGGETQIKPKYNFSKFYPPFASKKSGHPT